jgi:hypothetical protein
LDGSDLTGDKGEHNSFPNSGAGTNLPGEPNIDIKRMYRIGSNGLKHLSHMTGLVLLTLTLIIIYGDYILLPVNFGNLRQAVFLVIMIYSYHQAIFL